MFYLPLLFLNAFVVSGRRTSKHNIVGYKQIRCVALVLNAKMMLLCIDTKLGFWCMNMQSHFFKMCGRWRALLIVHSCFISEYISDKDIIMTGAF